MLLVAGVQRSVPTGKQTAECVRCRGRQVRRRGELPPSGRGLRAALDLATWGWHRIAAGARRLLESGGWGFRARTSAVHMLLKADCGASGKCLSWCGCRGLWARAAPPAGSPARLFLALGFADKLYTCRDVAYCGAGGSLAGGRELCLVVSDCLLTGGSGWSPLPSPRPFIWKVGSPV